ncbi:MAG: hypothetical protein Q9211_002699, partial [Gyalolechia sp. 1 TL-2023]
MCQYDLTETERQPILQAEALKEKDKAIASLRNELQLLQGQPRIKMEPRDDDLAMDPSHRFPVASTASSRPVNVHQRRYQGSMLNDSIYFGTPGTTAVVEEFANLSVNGQPANLTHLVPRGTDMVAFQVQPTNPFPTFWRTAEGTATLINLLPKDHQEIFFYLHAFQRRGQACSFPHLPDEVTETEVQRFLSNVKENADKHPEMLALLFATLAQGIQNGVYDKYGGAWHVGMMESECKLGNAFIHRDPDRLNPPVPPKEAAARRNLWWWIMYMDQQYSVTLGRPLGISSMGDCPPPESLVQDPVVQSLSNYISQFTILTRQILSIGYLNANQIDGFTEQLLHLRSTLPSIVQFDDTWLDANKPIPDWPLDMQAATLHAKMHTYILLLNRQRISNGNSQQAEGSNGITYSSRGRRRVLESCRAILQAFDFFHTRVPAGLVCWTVGQQAFNAAVLLVLAMLETNEATDLEAVQRAYSTFLDMQRMGIHRLAEAAVNRLGSLMKEVPSDLTGKETVMGQSGMILLEDPGLQGFLDGGFSPLSFQMAGSAFALDRPQKQRRTTTNHKDHEYPEVKTAAAARSMKSGSQRKGHAGRGAKPRPISTNKAGPRSSRSTVCQRHSGLPSPSMTEPSDRMHVPADITQWPLDSSSLASSDMTPNRISSPLISPSQQMFQGFPANEFDAQTQMSHQDQNFHPMQRAQTTFSESCPGFHHPGGPDPTVQGVTYSTQITPQNLTPTDLTPTDIVDFAAYGHFNQPQMHQQTPLHTPPFSGPFTTGEISCSYP